MSLFDNFERTIVGIDLDNPDFENKTAIHDWRNYVPGAWQYNWNEFTDRERKIIAIMAQLEADNEDWD